MIIMPIHQIIRQLSPNGTYSSLESLRRDITMYFSWEKIRLIWIAFYKDEKRSNNNNNDNNNNPYSFSDLPKEVVEIIAQLIFTNYFVGQKYQEKQEQQNQQDKFDWDSL
eukprot:TRINITY_DN1485_c0_g1_i1.p1 TRINITY_DN1485_c0_g1~~TRINITY_DN1485_c0_g1_i1.p1  ORF type:complete len:110 (-),score=33.00 TRINITY_DN1485_c0_g1_i1:110-439(-)